MQALWDRVFAAPHDDDARRVLADALLEQGDPRGELIAIQLKLARVEPDELGPREIELSLQEKALLDAHGDEWTGGWPFQYRPWFRRGFPERQHALAAEFIRHGARALEIAPTLCELVLSDEDPRRRDLAGLVVQPAAARLRHLSLPVTFQPQEAALLPKLSSLRSLAFQGGQLGDSGAAMLSGLQLQELSFEFDIGVRDGAALAALPLRRFFTRGNPVLPQAWPELQHLMLNRVEVAVQPLRWPKLRRLDLYETRLGRRRLKEVLEAGHPLVRRLSITGERIDATDLELRAAWPSLEVLKTDAEVRRLR